MSLLKSESVVNNIISPLLATINAYFPKVLLVVTLICVLYAAFLGLKYYLVRNDAEKSKVKLALAKRGAVTVVIIYAVFITLKVILSMILKSFI